MVKGARPGRLGGWEVWARKPLAFSRIHNATNTILAGMVRCTWVPLQVRGHSNMCLAIGDRGISGTLVITNWDSSFSIKWQWMYVTDNCQIYTYRIDCGEKGKGRSLSLSRSDSTGSYQAEKAFLRVAPRNCDLDTNKGENTDSCAWDGHSSCHSIPPEMKVHKRLSGYLRGRWARGPGGSQTCDVHFLSRGALSEKSEYSEQVHAEALWKMN